MRLRTIASVVLWISTAASCVLCTTSFLPHYSYDSKRVQGLPVRSGRAGASTCTCTSSSSSRHEGLDLDADRFQKLGSSAPKKKESSLPGFVEGPAPETKPDYDNIHGPLGKAMDTVFLKVFRSTMAEKVGVDSQRPQDDYQGLMELTAALNARYSDRLQVQAIAQDVLRSLFPSWLPGAYAVLFSKPFPAFSSRMNAWATNLAGTWLMGESEINDCEVDGGGIGENQGLLVKRCRFLEESGCASVCVNSCKIPTQQFFMEEMGLALTMTPDYETGECQFSFGLTPTAEGEFDAKNTPCLSRCPSSGSMRKWHDGGASLATRKCTLMDEIED